MKENKVILVGGGSGGHIFPLIALSEELQARSIPFVFVGSDFGLEKQIVTSYNLPFISIQSGKWRRYFTWKSFGANLVDIFRIVVGVFQAMRVIRKTRANTIVSKGGYVAVPMLIAGKLTGRKIVVHESDAVMGLTNRFGAKFAQNVLTAFSADTYPNADSRFIQAGIPIRKSLRQAAKLKSPKKSRPVILIMPCSQGSSSINEFVTSSLKELLSVADVVHMTGSGDYERCKSLVDELPEKLRNRYKVFAFIDRELPYYFQLADLVIGRASATTIAESALFGRAVYLIPLPTAASDHQTVNAKKLESVDAAWVDKQSDLDASKFKDRILEILANPSRLKEVGDNLKRYFNVESSLEKFMKVITDEKN